MTENEVQPAQHTFFTHACTQTHTSGPASRREAEASQPERRQGNVVSDHLIGLAPDRQRSLRQPVRGPKLTLQSHFGSGWLRAERLRKTNPEPQSFCLCHYWSLSNRSLAVFTSSGHIRKIPVHTVAATQAESGTQINLLDLCWYRIIYSHALCNSFSLVGDTDT